MQVTFLEETPNTVREFPEEPQLSAEQVQHRLEPDTRRKRPAANEPRRKGSGTGAVP